MNTADIFGIASLLITPTGRHILTNNIEASRLIKEQGLGEQGWEIQVTPWYEEKDNISQLTSGMKLGADACSPNAVDLSNEVAQLRSQLTDEEGERFRALGKLCADGMQQAIHAVHPGMTEYEITGLLSEAVENRGVQAIVNLIATDERIFSYRHPLPTSKQLQRYAMLVLCGRKWGLICSLTRLVHFGPLPDETRRKGQAVAEIDAAIIAATRPGNTMGDVFRTAQAAYASVGFPNEWQNHHQGGSAGYAPREVTAKPTSTEPILAGQVCAWNPSIAGVKSEDTIFVGEQTNEVLTEMADWPTIEVQIGGKKIKRPAILVKE
ncbi:MAG: M24 family metallopeptidase [Anaerolineales bacterium]|nr:M24 family metallopeptidase [Anaerolineales bacterium]